MIRHLASALLIALMLYVGGYLIFRTVSQQVWERDNKAYVIFPEGTGSILYYAWRPLTRVDGAITGMRFHIGPHR